MFITHKKILNDILKHLSEENKIIPSIFTQKIVLRYSKELEEDKEELELIKIIMKSRILIACEILTNYKALTKINDDHFRITEFGLDLISKYVRYIQITNDIIRYMADNLSAEANLIRSTHTIFIKPLR